MTPAQHAQLVLMLQLAVAAAALQYAVLWYALLCFMGSYITCQTLHIMHVTKVLSLIANGLTGQH